MINLEKTMVREIKYVNKLGDNTTINLESSVKYDSNYNKKEKQSLGKVFLKVGDEDGRKDFYLSIEFHGVFYVDEDLEADAVSNETYKLLYPHLQAYVSSVTALSGIPPLRLPSFQ